MYTALECNGFQGHDKQFTLLFMRIAVMLQVLVLGREKEGIPPEIISMLDATVEIPQLGVIRSLNVHVLGAIAMYEFTKQQLVARNS